MNAKRRHRRRWRRRRVMLRAVRKLATLGAEHLKQELDREGLFSGLLSRRPLGAAAPGGM